MAPRIWLITGTSSGIGSELAIKALAAGDRVIASSRSIARLGHLEAKGAAPPALDHNQTYEHVKAAVDKSAGAVPRCGYPRQQRCLCTDRHVGRNIVRIFTTTWN